MLYRLLAPLVRLIVRVFYRRIEVHGLEKIPAGCPLVFAANHPNMAMDPFMVGSSCDSPVHFLAKSTLFSPAPVGWLLRSLGAVPVYRRTDDASQLHKNRETFEECYRVLERGEAIGIFPEGTSLYSPRLQPLKTGAARIVLETEERNGFSKGVKIVPVGLNFRDRHLFRSDVLVLYGDPIDPSWAFDLYRNDPAAAVREVTDRIEASLEALTDNLKENQDDRFVKQLRQIYVSGYLAADPAGAPRDLKEAFEVDQRLVDAYAYFDATQTERTRKVKIQIETYLYMIDELGLTVELMNRRRLRLSWVLAHTLVRLPLLLLVGVPVWVWGFVTNYPPYRLCGVMADRVSTDLSEPATYKALFGTVLFIVYYAALTVLTALLGGIPVALLALASFPIAGFGALEVTDRLTRFVQRWRTAVLFRFDRDLATRLARTRDEIIAELRAMREEWLARPADS
ncbi:MAG: 1-acyl-sn-glycerol-3-phosphate acyltransferase [Candidatus Riflebacteria bacterium]|nr:1-acyl-sn-glycerol-3-phosphate acyltransferase [Candidatus Riflebacteria bacterium]